MSVTAGAGSLNDVRAREGDILAMDSSIEMFMDSVKQQSASTFRPPGPPYFTRRVRTRKVKVTSPHLPLFN